MTSLKIYFSADTFACVFVFNVYFVQSSEAQKMVFNTVKLQLQAVLSNWDLHRGPLKEQPVMLKAD